MTLPRIFVQIPSYRDRECQYTVRDLFEKARNPQRVFVGICWQFDPDVDEGCFEVEACPEQVRRIDFHARDAIGLGWARQQAQSLWRGEEYVLQIDSHMRFAPDWDVRMLDELAACPSPRPVLSIYPSSYWPPDRLQEDADCRSAVQAVRGFSRSGMLQFTVFFAPQEIPIHAPKPAAGVAGGFIFGPSRIIQDVPSDPEIYFEGEEPNLAIRLFTHGYDLFSPREVLIYHYYRRVDSRRPWDDADPATPTARTMRRMRQLVGMKGEDPVALGRYGPGTVRSLADYERFAGVDFNAASVASFTRHYPFVFTDEVTQALIDGSETKPAEDTALFVLGDEGVLFSGRRRRFYRLNATATLIWCALSEGLDVALIVEKYAAAAGCIDRDEARRIVHNQICHWQTWGVLTRYIPTLPVDTSEDEDETSAPETWPLRGPPGVVPRDFEYRLLNCCFRLRCFSDGYAELIHPVLAPLQVSAADADGLQRHSLEMMGIGPFHYLIVDDSYPPRLVAGEHYLVAEVWAAMTRALSRDPDSLLHLGGAILHLSQGGPTLLLGAGAARVCAIARFGSGRNPPKHASLAELCERFDPALRTRTTVQLSRSDRSVRVIPAPLAVPAGWSGGTPDIQSALEGLPLHYGFGAGAAHVLAPGDDTIFEPQRVARLVFLHATDAEHDDARLEPVSAADALADIMACASTRPRPAELADAAALIDWIEGIQCFALSAGSAEDAAAVLAEAPAPST